MVLLDFLTTVINGELVYYLETNPLYAFIGLPGIFAINLIWLIGMYYLYDHSKSSSVRHSIIFVMVMISIIRLSIAYNNFQAYLHPVSIEVASQIPKAVKRSYYLTKVIIPLVSTFFMGWLSFLLFKKDHYIARPTKKGLKWSK